MKLTEIRIDNFRSIKECHLFLNEVTAVIGENNAGKTALLRALNSVFNWEYEQAYFLNNAHQYAVRTTTKIVLIFEYIPDKEIYAGKLWGDKLNLIFKYAYGTTTRKRSLSCQTATGAISVDDDFLTELKKDIDYVYIPASRSNRDLTWTENSIFQRVLTAYSQYHTQLRDNVSAQVTRVAEKLKNNIFSKIEHELALSSLLNSDERYEFDYAGIIDYSLFLNKVGINIVDGSSSFPVTEYGSGIKSLSVIALYRTLAKLNKVNVILGIEEPETNLHPHAQKKLIASIQHNRQDSEIQAVFATHSTVIVDELNHENIILARRIPDSRRGFHTEFSQQESDFWDKYNLDEYKHNRFFRYKNSDFFFAKYVIVVESSTDAQVISELLRDLVREKMFFVSILNLDGIKNLKYPYYLLKSLKIPFSMVVDKDFLTQYKNDKLSNSRSATTYLPEYKNDANQHNPVINSIWDSGAKRNDLSDKLKQSYSKLFEYCAVYKLYPMQYCLEMDLVASAEGRAEYCRLMGILNNDNAYKALLVDRCEAIKEPDKVLQVLGTLAPAKYPYSYKKIRNAIAGDINSTF